MSGKFLYGKTRSDGTSADLNRQRWSPDHSEYRRDPEDRDSGSSPEVAIPEKDRPETLELEPELLLQPETRPISHEQLVVEVEGIYAGLVMVEAKCIDIDKRQSAAAQEKDLSKKFELKDDQWQSHTA